MCQRGVSTPRDSYHGLVRCYQTWNQAGSLMKITVFDAQGLREAQAVDFPALLASKDATTWVDITGPGQEDVRVLHGVSSP
jgi:hypothetical protein